MAIRLICGDGSDVRLPPPYFNEMALFKNHPELTKSRYYEMRCKPSYTNLNLVIGRIYSPDEEVTITDDNFSELKSVCEELGFSGLDREFREFETASYGSAVKRQLGTLQERADDCDIEIQGIEDDLESIRDRVQKFTYLEEKVAALEKLLTEIRALVDKKPPNSKDGVSETKDRKPERFGRRLREVTKFGLNSSFESIEPVGGRTYRGRLYSGRELAVKRYDPAGEWERMWFELSVMLELEHEAIMPLLGVSMRDGKIEAVFPWMESLFDVLKREREGEMINGWNATKKSIVVYGMAVAMAYIHSKNIAHCLLNPTHVFLNENFEPVVGGFWWSWFLEEPWYDERSYSAQVYTAPELFCDGRPSKAADVYSYVFVVYSMFTDESVWWGKRPRNAFELVTRVLKSERPMRVPGITEVLWTLIERGWQECPSYRPSFAEIVQGLGDDLDKWVFPGTDCDEFREYQSRILHGVEL